MLHLQKLQIDLSLLLKYILHFVSIESKLVKTLSEPQIAVLFDFCFVFPPMARRESDSLHPPSHWEGLCAYEELVPCVCVCVRVTVMCSDKTSEVWLLSIFCPPPLSVAPGHITELTQPQNM